MRRLLDNRMDEILRDRATVVPFHRPLIPFLKEPWSSKSKYPAILLETFLYGIYVVLFCCCVFILWRRKPAAQRLLLFATSLMFILASADMILTAFFFFHFVLGSTPSNVQHSHSGTGESWNKILEVKFSVYVVANAITNGLLINRCYQVWQDTRIIVAPISLVVVGTVISFVSIRESQLGDKLLAASFIISAAASLSVTTLIAIRIWWSSKKIRKLLTLRIDDLCEFIISLIFDSGAIYSLSIFLYLVFHTLVLDASLTQIAAVTLTAMVLRKLSSEDLGHTSTYSPTTTLPDTQEVIQRTRSFSVPRHFRTESNSTNGNENK